MKMRRGRERISRRMTWRRTREICKMSKKRVKEEKEEWAVEEATAFRASKGQLEQHRQKCTLM